MTCQAEETKITGKCQATTKANKQCSFNAVNNGYCKRHSNQAPEVAPRKPEPTTLPTQQWQPKKKKKRPDVAERLKQRANIVETCVKASLSGRVGVGWSPEARQVLQDEINKWVLSTSKTVHRLSLFFNRLLLHLLVEDKPLPSFEDSLFTGIAMCGMKKINKKSSNEYASLIQDFYDNEFKDQFPAITRPRGDCQAIAIAALRYKTNFLNSCFVPFFQRQLNYIHLWLKVNEIEDVQAYQVQWRINSWKVRGVKKYQFSEEVENFISEEQRLLSDKPVHESWLKRNTSKVLHYYYHVLEYYTTAVQGNKFRLAPLCHIKCHFLTIDDTVLYEILTNVRNKVPSQVPEQIADALDRHGPMTDEVWRLVFNYGGLRRQRRFSHQVDTDGTSVSFHFQTTKKQTKKSGRRRRSNQLKKSTHIVSVDPGRSNIITAYDSKTEEYYRLSRQSYYRSAGMKKRTSRVKRRLLPLQGVYNAMSKAPTKSINNMDWYQYQEVVTRNYNRLWELHTTKSNRRDAFRVHCLKEKCLDRFFNKFVHDGQKPIVAYGAVSLNPTGKGELSVPVKYVYKKCCERFYTPKVNEGYTTKMHHKCQQPTVAVMNARSRSIRGLRWCPTCRELVSRDNNASLNIQEVFLSEERPAYLCHTFPRADLPSKFLRKGAVTHRVQKNHACTYNTDQYSKQPCLQWQPIVKVGGMLELVEDWNY